MEERGRHRWGWRIEGARRIVVHRGCDRHETRAHLCHQIIQCFFEVVDSRAHVIDSCWRKRKARTATSQHCAGSCYSQQRCMLRGVRGACRSTAGQAVRQTYRQSCRSCPGTYLAAEPWLAWHGHGRCTGEMNNRVGVTGRGQVLGGCARRERVQPPALGGSGMESPLTDANKGEWRGDSTTKSRVGTDHLAEK